MRAAAKCIGRHPGEEDALDDDRVVRLLEEIRDLQRQHLENYQKALKNQEESMAQNREWRKKYRSGRWIFILLFFVVMFGLWLAVVARR